MEELKKYIIDNETYDEFKYFNYLQTLNNNEILLLFNSFKYRCKDLKFIHKLQNYLEQYINCEKPLDYILEIKYLINSNYKFSIDINNLLKQIFNYDYDLFCYVMNSNVNYTTLDINKIEILNINYDLLIILDCITKKYNRY